VAKSRLPHKEPNIKYLTKLAFVKPPIIEVDYKEIYPSEKRIQQYSSISESKDVKDTKHINNTKDNAATTDTLSPFKEQFYKLLDAFYIFGEKKIFPNNSDDVKADEARKSLISFIERIFDKKYSRSLSEIDFEVMKVNLEEILHQLNNADLPFEKRKTEYFKLH
jgi:hypothetical protein